MSRLKELAPPPRNVPLGVRIKAMFGGLLQQMGWAFFASGMFFMTIFVVHAGLADGLAKQMAFRGEVKSTEGVVTYARPTNASENETEVVLFGFEYELEGEKFSGECYFTGWKYDEGQKVTVEYLAEDPVLGRIKGSRWSVFGPIVALFIGIFPFIGVVMIGISLPKCWRSAKLLKFGRVAYGTLISKEPTNQRVNEEMVYELTFKFEAESTGRDHLATAKTHNTERLEDDEQEPLLYLPSFPDHAVMFDSLPGRPSVNSRGHLEGGLGGALFYLLCPVLALGLTVYLVNDLVSTFSG